jgi:ribitol-5-phosphate 2-dehydrogenase (NADP+) / D-ribitol-5-phosphate cytidylyltransferase
LKPKIIAILLMGGVGTRFSPTLPKQLHKMGGKPIFLHTVERFLEFPQFQKIILPVPAEWIEEVKKNLLIIPEREKVQVITGGETRQRSSYLSLLACDEDTDYVVIHDAVRPFVSREIVQKNLDEVLQHQAVDTCIPSTDTLVHSLDGQWIEKIPSRKELLRGQTPQSFSFPLIMKAHQKALQDHVQNSTDDCSLVQRMGHFVKIVLGDEKNIKITTELDLFLAEQLLHRSFEEGIQESLSCLAGKTFVVTGGTGGIGQALCQELSRQGAKVIPLSKTTKLFQADLAQPAEVESAFSSIYSEYGAIDGLINSIGSFIVKDFSLLSPEEIMETIRSNLLGPLYCCKYAKLKEKGHIVNISSSSYSRGRKDYPVYSAAKAAVVNFTQGLAESRPDLLVNVIVPQRTNTSLRRANFPEEDVQHLLEPEEVAEKIAKLLKSSSITGTIVEVRKKG